MSDGFALDKDRFYFRLAGISLQLRRHQKERPWLYQADYFTGDIARHKDVGLPPVIVAKLFRAMRTDLSLGINRSGLGSTYEIERSVASYFQAAVHEYAEHHTRPGCGSCAKRVARLVEGWDGSAARFYRRLYDGANSVIIAGWAVYEMEVIHNYYRLRIDSRARLSGFDVLALRRGTGELSSQDAARLIRGLSGVPIDDDILERHQNVLLYGQPHAIGAASADLAAFP